jgi:hypothetical protein
MVSTSGFKINSRRYMVAGSDGIATVLKIGAGQGFTLVHFSAKRKLFL